MISNISYCLSASAWMDLTTSFKYRPAITDAARRLIERPSDPNSSFPVLFAPSMSVPRIDAMRWGYADKATKKTVHFIHAEGQNFAYRCLIAVTEFSVQVGEGDNIRVIAFRPANGEPISIGAVWRPEGTLGPRGFAIMTCNAGDIVGAFSALQPVIVDSRYYAEFLDPAKDVTSIQKAMKGGLVVEAEEPLETASMPS